MINEKIKQMIAASCDVQISPESIQEDSKFDSLGFNSMTFIRMIVAIENEFELEFGDADMTFNKLPDFKSLSVYVQAKLNERK